MMQDMQIAFLLDIQKTIGNDLLDRIFAFISFLGNAGWIWIVLGVLILLYGLILFFKAGDAKGKFNLFIPAGLAVLIALVFSLLFTNIILKNAFDALRPFEIYSYDVVISLPHDSSFPSGHSSASFAAAFAYFKYFKKTGIWLLVLAALIAFSRLYLFVHFPIDVAVGSLLGLLYGFVAYKIVDRLLRPRIFKAEGNSQ
jgi:undecaprenyl-diphosphatase